MTDQRLLHAILPEAYSSAMFEMISGFEGISAEHFEKVWEACRQEVIRLNTRTAPKVAVEGLPAKRSYEEQFSVHGQGQIMGWNAAIDACTPAFQAVQADRDEMLATAGMYNQKWSEATQENNKLQAENERLQRNAFTWLYSHCKAIGMHRKSDSETWEHDIALFTLDLKAQVDTLRNDKAELVVALQRVYDLGQEGLYDHDAVKAALAKHGGQS